VGHPSLPNVQLCCQTTDLRKKFRDLSKSTEGSGTHTQTWLYLKVKCIKLTSFIGGKRGEAVGLFFIDFCWIRPLCSLWRWLLQLTQQRSQYEHRQHSHNNQKTTTKICIFHHEVLFWGCYSHSTALHLFSQGGHIGPNRMQNFLWLKYCRTMPGWRGGGPHKLM
jgi:hypothetical protein